ncbi:RHS repeat-associated core domain-containing protein [Pseudomonas syringae]|uniref:RHS repeat-associated core domain-containing protein n=1 Tax=Pseudomonas syringae TaxID=317 RepID=UPI0023F7102C|nr:RHS repeat-associated core domain-containing protein [Pseudomonas syringae]MDF7795781.1 RHS repeat-associated core domain-containing protein [Pseudomonas syringae]
MASSGQSVLCVYRYDPLDRLADCSPAGQGSIRFFYQKTHLATQIQGQVQHTLMRTDEHLLACLSAENNQRDGVLLATDQQQSVTAAQGLEFVYTPYGHRHPSGSASLPGFTGQRVDPVTGHYLLGNGYRAFNPVLMRFNSPDSLSPFGEGGVNAYGYCGGDPVNRVDLTGHMVNPLKLVLKIMKVKRKSTLAVDGSSSVNLISVSPISSSGVNATVSRGRHGTVSNRQPTVNVIANSEPPTSQASQQAKYHKNAYHTKKTEGSALYDRMHEDYANLADKVDLANRMVGKDLDKKRLPSYWFVTEEKKQIELFDGVEDILFSQGTPPPSYHLANSAEFQRTSYLITQAREIRQKPFYRSLA